MFSENAYFAPLKPRHGFRTGMSSFTVSKSLIALFAGLLLLFLSSPVAAQLTVQGGFTPQQLAETIAGPGITVSNAVINGSPQAHGTFNGFTNDIIVIRRILMSKGTIAFSMGYYL